MKLVFNWKIYQDQDATHLDIGYEFYLPDELLLHVVLDQVVVDPPLPVGQTVPGDVEWALRRLQSTVNSKVRPKQNATVCDGTSHNIDPSSKPVVNTSPVWRTPASFSLTPVSQSLQSSP